MSGFKASRPGLSLQARLDRMSMPEPNSGCTLWLGAINRFGYGKFSLMRKIVGAHRVAYELANGPVPDGMVLDHKCRVRCCINPGHLEVVTNRTNILRGTGWSAVNNAKTHCPKGHPYEGDNVVVWRSKDKRARYCRTCHRRKMREQYLKRTARA